MTALWLRWTWRDLRSRWAQVGATALVLAIGVGGFAGLRSLEQWRVDSAERSLAALRAPDLRVNLAEGDFAARGQLVGALEAVPDGLVATAQERLVIPSQINAAAQGKSVLVPALLVGAPGRLGHEPVESVAIKSAPSGPRSEPGVGTAILDWNFAHHYDLPSSGHIRIAELGEVGYRGVGITPQYLLILDQTGIAGGEAGLAVVYLPLADAQRALGRPDAVNELLIRTAPGADPERALDAVGDALAAALPGKPVTMVPANREPVAQVILRDAHNDQKTYTVFAILLLVGATLACFNLVSRVVEAQRREIGIGMALGVEPRILARRPLTLGLQIGLIGAALGVPVGIGLAALIKGLLRTVLPLPVYVSTFPVGLYAEGAAIAIAIPILAAALPVRRALAVRPIEAIRSEYRNADSGGPAHLIRRLHPPGGPLARLPLRNLMRTPRRTLTTLLGLGAVMTAVVAVLGMVDSIGGAADRARADAASGVPGRLEVSLTRLVAADGPAVRRIANRGGVRDFEPGLTLPATVSSADGQLGVALTLIDPHSPIWHPRALSGTVAGAGIVLAEKAADDLGVWVGDPVRLQHPRRDGAGMTLVDSRVRVIGIHSNPIRAFAYMDGSQAAALGLGGLANQVTVVPGPGTPPSKLQHELFGRPGIASARPADDTAQNLQASVDSYAGAIQMVVFITLGLGLLVAFTSASVSVDERRREYATMFAFGLPLRSGLRVAIVESLSIGVLGTIVGLGTGIAVSGWIVTELLSQTFPDLGFEPTLSAASILTTVLLGVGAVALAPLFTYRRMRRMDIPSTLRVME